MFLFLSHFLKSFTTTSNTENMPKGRVIKWQRLFLLKARGPLRFEADSLWRRVSSERPLAALSFLLPQNPTIPESALGRGHRLARSRGRRHIPVPQHVASIPMKACLITRRSGSCRVFLMWLFLGLTIHV